MLAALVCILLALAHGGDLVSHVVSNKFKTVIADLPNSAPIVPTFAAAAQGDFEGPAVLEAVLNDGNWPALTGINLAVGVVVVGIDGKGGCGLLKFHHHPNCYELMTVLSGKGGFSQKRHTGEIVHSRVMTKGSMYLFEQGAHHYWENLDPDNNWTVEISFTCSEISAISISKWFPQLDAQLVQQFWPGVSETAANLLTSDFDDAPQFVADCKDDGREAFHTSVGENYDHFLEEDHFLDSPTYVPDDQGTGGSVEYYTFRNPGSLNNTRMGLAIGKVKISVGGVQNPAVNYNGHTVVHVLKGEVLVAQFTWDNKMAVEILHEHDLILIPLGSLHFMVNMQDSEAEMLTHFDTPGKSPESTDYEPQVTVITDFFPAPDGGSESSRAKVLETNLQVPGEAAAALASASADNKLFAEWKGDLAVLKKWKESKPEYCPLGCITESTVDVNEDGSIDQAIEDAVDAWDMLPSTPLTDKQMRYVALAALTLTVLWACFSFCSCGLAACGLLGAAGGAAGLASERAPLV